MEQDAGHFILTFTGQLLAIFPAAAILIFILSDLYPWRDEAARRKVSKNLLYFPVFWVAMNFWALVLIAPKVSARAHFIDPLLLNVLAWALYVSFVAASFLMITAKGSRLFTVAYLAVNLLFVSFVYLASCLAVTGRWF